MPTINPIDSAQQYRVVEETLSYIHHAGKIFDRQFNSIPVLFDLSGRAAGMYKANKKQKLIRYNPYIFGKFFDDNLAVTVPHEVAHYITDQIFGMRQIRPHGREWRALMAEFKVDPSATCDYDLEGIPLRTQRRYVYVCGCTSYKLSSHRHNKVVRGCARYYCRKCKDELHAG